ncbi:MAG: DUF2807 domain-containing protein [Flavobacteriales bacterium]|nr:DUF2807 domain-containing protein [Flavobacteriales bacterium]
MKRNVLHIITVLMLFVLQHHLCFAQQLETKALKLFNKVKVSNNINVTLIPGNENKAELRLKNISSDKVFIDVNNAELQVKTQGIFNDADIHVVVFYTEALKKISTSFGGLIRSDSLLISDKLELDCRLDGFANLLIDVNELKISAGQGSNVNVAGKSKNTVIDATTGANVKTELLISDNAVVKSIMGAQVWINVRNNFNAQAVSGGKIYYSIQPTGEFKKSTSTGGEILQQ